MNLIGQTISHYEILQKLGGGGMGIVYKARDQKLDRFVALKFLPPELSRDEHEKKRLIREAKAASSLEHKNICTVHEIGETADGQIFMAMAYYEGETQKKKIESRLLPVKEALEIAIKVCEGLQRAHEEKIVHRDVKPANIMITRRNEVRIMDFGLAKIASSTQLTTTGTTVGTVAYMSPEQARGQKVDRRTDVWSLGVLLYELLTGQQPFRGENAQAVVFSILNGEPEPPTGLRSGIPLGLERVINKCLAKEAGERYQHMDELAVDLRAILRELESGSTSVQPVRQPGKRNFAFYGTVALAILVLAVVLFQLDSKDSSPVDRKSIAVLPFENLSGRQEENYFSDGITEDILSQISKIADLKVISSVATKKYKNANKTAREISAELNVATVLAGSVRREEKKVRIVCQLVDGKTEQQLWTETDDRDLADIFTIQSEVAQDVARTLEAKLSPVERQLIETQPTANPRAYEFYLKGRDYRLAALDPWFENLHGEERFKEMMAQVKAMVDEMRRRVEAEGW